MASVFNFLGSKGIDRGASFSRSFTWKDSSVDPAVAIDLTGYTASFILFKEKDGPTVLESTTANGKAVITAAEGKTVVSFTSTDTATLEQGVYYYALVLNGGVSSTVRLLDGSIEVV